MVIAVALMHYLNLINHCKLVLATTQMAGAIGQNPNLSDLEKEQKTQQLGKQLLGLFAKVLFGSLLAFGLPIGVLFGLAQLSLIDFNAIVTILFSWPFMLGFSLVVIVLWVKSGRG